MDTTLYIDCTVYCCHRNRKFAPPWVSLGTVYRHVQKKQYRSELPVKRVLLRLSTIAWFPLRSLLSSGIFLGVSRERQFLSILLGRGGKARLPSKMIEALRGKREQIRSQSLVKLAFSDRTL